MGVTQQRITEYLAGYAAQWPRQGWDYAYDWAWSQPQTMADRYTAAEIANELLADAEFQALKLGTWLSTPDGELLATAVTALTPPPYGEDAKLLIDALKLAAEQQQAEARKLILAGVAVGGGVLALAIATSGK